MPLKTIKKPTKFFRASTEGSVPDSLASDGDDTRVDISEDLKARFAAEWRRRDVSKEWIESSDDLTCDSCTRKGATCVPAENTARCVRCRDAAIGCSRVSLERRYRATTLCGLQRSGKELVDALISELQLDCRRKRKKGPIVVKPESGRIKQSVGPRGFKFCLVGTAPPPRRKIFEDDPPNEELRNKVVEVIFDSDSDDLEMDVLKEEDEYLHSSPRNSVSPEVDGAVDIHSMQQENIRINGSPEISTETRMSVSQELETQLGPLLSATARYYTPDSPTCTTMMDDHNATIASTSNDPMTPLGLLPSSLTLGETPLTQCLPTALVNLNHDGPLHWAKTLLEQALAGSMEGTIPRREVEEKLRRALDALDEFQEKRG